MCYCLSIFSFCFRHGYVHYQFVMGEDLKMKKVLDAVRDPRKWF